MIRDGKYLLVRDKGHDKYSLPGGGMERGEEALAAACRELSEELGVKAYRAEELFDYTNEASFNDHTVVLCFRQWGTQDQPPGTGLIPLVGRQGAPPAVSPRDQHHRSLRDRLRRQSRDL